MKKLKAPNSAKDEPEFKDEDFQKADKIHKDDKFNKKEKDQEEYKEKMKPGKEILDDDFEDDEDNKAEKKDKLKYKGDKGEKKGKEKPEKEFFDEKKKKDKEKFKDKSKNKEKISKNKWKKCGIMFPVSRIARRLREVLPAKAKLSHTAAVMCAANMEYVLSEAIELAGQVAQEEGKKKITPRHLTIAVKNDDELNQLIKATIAGGGVVPNIRPELIRSQPFRSTAAQQFPRGPSSSSRGFMPSSSGFAGSSSLNQPPSSGTADFMGLQTQFNSGVLNSFQQPSSGFMHPGMSSAGFIQGGLQPPTGQSAFNSPGAYGAPGSGPGSSGFNMGMGGPNSMGVGAGPSSSNQGPNSQQMMAPPSSGDGKKPDKDMIVR